MREFLNLRALQHQHTFRNNGSNRFWNQTWTRKQTETCLPLENNRFIRSQMFTAQAKIVFDAVTPALLKRTPTSLPPLPRIKVAQTLPLLITSRLHHFHNGSTFLDASPHAPCLFFSGRVLTRKAINWYTALSQQNGQKHF